MTNNTQNFITVSFAKMFPGKLVDIVLNGDRTLRALLVFTGVVRPEESIAPESDIRVNAHKVHPDTVLQDGDKVMIFGLIKGNADDFITVRVGKAPGAAPEAIVIAPFATVAEAMAAAEIDGGLYQIFVNDQPAGPTAQLRDGDLIIIKNSPVEIGPEIGDDYREDYENREDEDFVEENQNETPSQKLYQFAQIAERKAKLIRKIAHECDTNDEFRTIMFRVFGQRPSRW